MVVRRQSGVPDEVVATLDANGKLEWKAGSASLPNHTGEMMFVIRWRVQTLSADTFVRARFHHRICGMTTLHVIAIQKMAALGPVGLAIQAW